ncbi:Putative ribonuclease H protein At1g65750 [Linum perenne]
MIFEDIKWDVEAIISQALFWELSSWKTHQLGRKVPGFARQTQLIGWRLGGEGWFTLNTGGSFRPSSNLVAAGGIIRDDQGRFVSAFVSNLGSCSVVRAEMKGIVDGMTITWERGICKLRIQTDSFLAFNLLTSGDSGINQLRSLCIDSGSSKFKIGRL